MRSATFVMLSITLFVVSGCGGGSKFANKPRPATPVNLTVYVDNSRVSVSPSTVGAGEVVFIITNQASNAQSLRIHPVGNSSDSLASTSPINPQSTDQVAVDFSRPGEYMISTTGSASTDAAGANQAQPKPAALHIGPTRPASSGALLQP